MRDLTRQFRPGTWDEIIGQDHVVKTLQNEIKNNCVGHAYLFEGPRGTGKTTTGRVFARCLDAQVIELDAASNNGVENIRNLRDDVLYLPADGRKYKVYIIDEVHMITAAGFNAFLKTLEEPPAHVIFVLATTDPQKIPVTILSRCQRFSLKRITVQDIVKRLQYICDAEKIALDKGNEGEVLEYIARQVDGGMRDAIKLLQKCTSLDDVITIQTVVDALGSVNVQHIESIVQHLLSKDVKNVISHFNNLVMEGVDIKIFLADTVEYLKDSMTDDIANSNYNIDARMHLTDGMLELLSSLRNATQVKTVVELRMIKMCMDTVAKPAAPAQIQEQPQPQVVTVQPNITVNTEADKDVIAGLVEKVNRHNLRFEALEMTVDQLKFKR